MNEKIKEALGVALVVVGIFILIVQPFSPTGAVIDISTSKAKLSSFVALVMILGGIVLAMSAVKVKEDLEGRVSKSDARQIIEKKLHLRPVEASNLLNGREVVKYRELGNRRGEVEEIYMLKEGRLGVGIENLQAEGHGLIYMEKLISNVQKTAKHLGQEEIDVYAIAPVERTEVLLRRLGFEKSGEYHGEDMWRKTYSVNEKDLWRKNYVLGGGKKKRERVN